MSSWAAESESSEVFELLNRVGHAHEQSLANAIKYADNKLLETQEQVQVLREQLASHGISEVETKKWQTARALAETPKQESLALSTSDVVMNLRATKEARASKAEISESTSVLNSEGRRCISFEVSDSMSAETVMDLPASKISLVSPKPLGQRGISFSDKNGKNGSNTLKHDSMKLASSEKGMGKQKSQEANRITLGLDDGELDLARARGQATTITNPELTMRQAWTFHPESEKADSVILMTKSRNVAQFLPTKEERAGRFSLRSTLKHVGHLKSRYKCQCSSLIAPPGSNWVLAWDCARAVLIFYDTIMIPFGLAFAPADNILLTGMDWITMLFWTVDMVLTFFIGYIDKGRIVMSPVQIGKQYLITWFLLDILVVAGDWFNNVGSASSGGSGSVSGLGKLVRSLRAIRMLRLLRLLKLRRMMAELQDHINSEYTYLLLSLTKLLFFILFLNHGIACLWYWLGRRAYEEGRPSWVGKNRMEEAEIGYKYTTSLHWTLTQFTPASMEVMPRNTEERTMSVVVLIFALVAFSSFVASISTSMTALRNMNAETNKQFWMLRRFLKQQGVERQVARRILKYLEYIVEKKQGKVQQPAIKILEMLSGQLREELTYELTCPHLMGSTFFQYFLGFPLMDVVVRHICASAMKKVILATADVLFYVGDEAKHVYIFLGGGIQVFDDEDVIGLPVEELEWVGEIAFWTNWKHTTRCQAQRESEIIFVAIDKFVEECHKSVVAWALAAKYAKHFLTLLAADSIAGDLMRDETFRESMMTFNVRERWSESGPTFNASHISLPYGHQNSAEVMKNRMSLMLKERQEEDF